MKIEEERGVLRKEDYMSFDSEIRRLIACLEPDDSADYVCAGNKQFFGPGKVL